MYITLTGFSFGSSWWMIILMVVILVIFTFTSFNSRKRKKSEKERRQKEVKDVIKKYMRDELKVQHKTIEFEKVISRTSKDFRYRDVFDVIVKLYDSKKNDFFETKVFEVEGFTKQITKKEFETIWKVNSELNLEQTLKKIELEKNKKSKKLRKKDPEIKKLLEEEKQAIKNNLEEEKIKNKQNKQRQKKYEKPKTPVSEKFTGFKEKGK